MSKLLTVFVLCFVAIGCNGCSEDPPAPAVDASVDSHVDASEVSSSDSSVVDAAADAAPDAVADAGCSTSTDATVPGC